MLEPWPCYNQFMKKEASSINGEVHHYVKFFDMGQREQFQDLSIAVMHSFASQARLHVPKGTKVEAQLIVESGLGYLQLSLEDKAVETVGLVATPEVLIPDLSMFEVINEMAEKLFREESRYGLKDPQKLDAIINACMGEFFGHVQYPGIVEKAAAFWFKIADAQCFHNGNKRTALLTALFVLSMNGFELENVDGDELYAISLKIANKQMDQPAVSQFIRRNLMAKLYPTRTEAETIESSFEINMKIDNFD